MIIWQEEETIRSLGRSHPADPLMDAFHETTKLTSYGLAQQAVRTAREGDRLESRLRNSYNYKLYVENDRRALQADMPEALLGACLKERQSIRTFDPTPLDLSLVAQLLVPTLARRRSFMIEDTDRRQSLAPYPSGGAMYPVEHYVIALNVEGLSRSVWYFDPVGCELVSIAENVELSKIESAFVYAPGWFDTLGIAVVQTALFERSCVKYGPRGYRLGLLEAGFAGQNILLAACALELAALPWAGFFDDRLAALLDNDPLDEPVLSTILVGRPALG